MVHLDYGVKQGKSSPHTSERWRSLKPNARSWADFMLQLPVVDPWLP